MHKSFGITEAESEIADNFYMYKGCSIPRWLLYELCMECYSPDFKYRVNKATFGKLVRSVFPDLGTRRLGKKGSSSIFYHSGNVYSYGDAAGQNIRMVVQLANEYCSHCQDILHMVRNNELDKVGNCIMSFWRSMQPANIALMASSDVCQLFKSYDRQLFKEMENILLNDFLEVVPVEDLQTIRLFSKNVEFWLLNALKEFPLPLQTSKYEEVTLFIKRLRRKTDLSNMAKTMRTVLNSNSKGTVLQSHLHAAISQGYLDLHRNPFDKSSSLEELPHDIELKCLHDLISMLAHSTDIRVLLNCVSSNLQAFIIQPNMSKEEFRKRASNFQLRWNFVLSQLSKAIIFLNGAESFGFRILVDKAKAIMLTSHLA
ncbi:DNA-binding protein RFX8 [Podargus strigoides]